MKKWPIARLLTSSLVTFVAVLTGITWVLVAVLVFVVSITRDIQISGWNVAAAQLARWLMIALGFHLIRHHLALSVSHGRTRREFMGQASVFTLVLAGASAVFITIGFWLESLVYGAMDWPQKVDQPYFTSGTELPSIFVAYWAMFAVWTVIGMLVTSGFDRSHGTGLLTLVLAFGLAVPAVMTVGGAGSLPLLSDLPGLAGTSLVTPVALCVASWAVGLGVTWGLVRDMPLRTRTA